MIVELRQLMKEAWPQLTAQEDMQIWGHHTKQVVRQLLALLEIGVSGLEANWGQTSGSTLPNTFFSQLQY